MEIEKPATLDLLDTSGVPALSSTSDMPVVETKPDATPAAPEPAPEEGKTDSESATEPESTSASDKPKEAKGVQKRLDELVKQREQAEARAEAERQEKLRLLALLEEGRKKPEPAETSPTRPTRDDYETPDQWEDALIAHSEELARWTAKQEIERERTEHAEQSRQREITANSERAQVAFAERTEKYMLEKPDFKEVAFNPDVEVSMQMAAAIIESEAGPALQYYLGQNPAEAARIMQLSPQRQFVEMGKLEAKLTAPVAAPAPISRAPAPIRPTVPAADTSTVDPENESVDAYATRRRKELGVGDPQSRVRH